jgi:hypothetical protein
MQRYCPCGRRIAGKRDLCDECYSIYGRNVALWPAWLQYQVADMKREYSQDCRCCEREDNFVDSSRYNLMADITGKQA